MKKVLLIAAFAVVGFLGVNAQEEDKDFKDDVNEVVEKAKEGGFYIGANIGLPIGDSGDFTKINFGFDAAYLFEVIPNLEVGGLVGYIYFTGDGVFLSNPKDASFIPIAASARYSFNNHQFFAGLDTGYAVKVTGYEEVNGGFYVRPKFGYNFGPITLIGSFTSISGGKTINGDLYNTTFSFNYYAANIGVEFGF